MNNRISPRLITALRPFEIFVFGSNLAAKHGAGAAKQAVGWGASKKIAKGLSGNTYAIPTKSYRIQTLPLEVIQVYVNNFIKFARFHPQYTFLVTEIGCGLAGYKPEQIAPMFIEAIKLENVHLPESFWIILNKE